MSEEIVGPLPPKPRAPLPPGSVVLVNEAGSTLVFMEDGYTLAAHYRAEALACWDEGVTLIGWDWESRPCFNPVQFKRGFLGGALDMTDLPYHTHRVGL